MNEMNMYRIKIFGRKTITPPTPPMMPSTKRSFNAPSAMCSRMSPPIHSTNASIHSIG